MLQNLRKISIPVQVAVVALSFQLLATYSGVRGENPPTVPNLENLPERIGDWKLTTSMSLEREVVDLLRPDSYIDRHYSRQSDGAPINLFVAYFKSLKSGYGPHSPAVCLPGSGWLVRTSQTIGIPTPRGTIQVNEYWMTKGNQQILVRYWYQNRRRSWAPEVMAKMYLLPDMIMNRRSELALVRTVTMLRGSDIESARTTSAQFIANAFPLIHSQLPE